MLGTQWGLLELAGPGMSWGPVFDAIVNRIVFLISLVDCSVMYINVIEVCMLVMYPVTFVNLLILTFFSPGSLGLATYKIISSANR